MHGAEARANVAIPREDEALKETAYLLSSRANARRLMQSIDNVRNGRVEQHELIDTESGDQ